MKSWVKVDDVHNFNLFSSLQKKSIHISTYFLPLHNDNNWKCLGNLLISGSDDTQICIWDYHRNGRLVTNFETVSNREKSQLLSFVRRV